MGFAVCPRVNASLTQRLFGFGRLAPSNTVAEMLQKVHGRPPEGGPSVIVAQRDDTVAEVYALCQRLDLHHVPVVSGKKVVGIVSSKDLLDFFASDAERAPAEVTLEEVMTRDPETVRKDASIREAIRVLAHSTFRCLPVVDADGEVYDVLTTRDLVLFLELSFE